MTDVEQRQAMLSLLTSIDASLKKLVAIAEKRKVGDSAPVVADDRDLDGPHGDETVKFAPRGWDDRDGIYKGNPMSQCPPAFLDLLAEAFESFAKKNTDKGDPKKAGYDRRSAARARGWATRLRNGWKPPQSSLADDDAFGQDSDFE